MARIGFEQNSNIGGNRCMVFAKSLVRSKQLDCGPKCAKNVSTQMISNV
jgi:hypothetical protein